MIKLSKIIWFICSSSLLILAGCQKADSPVYEKISEEIPDQEARNIIITNSNGKILEYKMKANYMQKFVSRNMTYADTAEITSYNKHGEIETVLNCIRLELDESQNIFIATGNVVVNSENTDLFTEYLLWNRKTNEFTAKDGVKIIRGENVMLGEEMRSDAKMTKIEITKVSAEGKLSEEDINW